MSSSRASSERHLEAGRRALSLGDLATADARFVTAIADAEGEGGDPEQLAAALGARAQLLYQAKRFADAAPLFRRALELREAALGEDDPALVPALHNLAAVCLAAGDSNGAEPLLRRALVLLERVHGPNDRALTGVLNGLSQLHLKRGAWAEAEPLLRHLLRILSAEGEERPEVATVMASLASVHHALAEHEAAERLLRRVLEIRERTLAPNHFAIATTLEALAETCATRGKLDEALALLERALEMRERTLGGAHPSLAVVRAKIADLQLQLSQDAFAVPLMELAPEPPRPVVAPPAPSSPAPNGAAPSLARLRTITEFHPGHSSPSSSAPLAPEADIQMDVIRRLATELEDHPDAGVAERATPSTLALSILPTGSALVLPGAELSGVSRNVDPDLPPDDGFEDREGHAPSWSSHLARPAVRIAAGVSVVTIALIAALTLRGGSGAAELTANEWGSSAGDVRQPATPTGLAVTSPSAGLDAASIGADTVSTDGRSTPTTRAEGESLGAASRSDARAATTTRPTTPALDESTLLPQAMPGRIPSDVELRVDATVPTLEIGTAPTVIPPSRAAAARNRRPTAYGAQLGFKPATLIGDVPDARYPAELERTGLRGEVVVSFVVDTLGRVDPSSFRVVRATDMRFIASVSAVLPRLRFMPAESDGRKLTQTVEMPFRFNP